MQHDDSTSRKYVTTLKYTHEPGRSAPHPHSPRSQTQHFDNNTTFLHAKPKMAEIVSAMIFKLFVDKRTNAEAMRIRHSFFNPSRKSRSRAERSPSFATNTTYAFISSRPEFVAQIFTTGSGGTLVTLSSAVLSSWATRVQGQLLRSARM